MATGDAKAIEQTVAALGRMTVAQLREKYLEVFGEPSRSGNRDFLFKRVACRTRLGVEPETMLRAWQFPLEEFAETLKNYEHVKPDAAKVDEYTGYIAKQWDLRFRRRPGSEYLTYAEVEDEEGDGDGE